MLKRDCPKTANIAHRGSDRISPLRVARLSSRWAHPVREPPVLPGLNRHWPDTLANCAMAHKIFGRNRLFHPGQIEILQPTDALDRAGSALRLIEVEHQPHTGADRP